ncbi:hypothetical protein N657DRAFT_570851 [Parathielavia appendiculata]|uniref:Rad21/Rec8-like protein N-terminal domain-containing protein n=1 Tax=Parathielavia appendiculata TaxID=2587402 RepID=A0AAN6U3K4_9PEZI|nr:hypothetical protein N657DRAFT_570851 [Parathielavia appendiculata]
MFYSHEILTSQDYGVATVCLLYGLSRVYSQQCHYVLTDAERVQAHMRAFYSALGGSDNALDPQAGKSNRKELILEDDPEFELNPDLPAFHFDDDGNLVIPQGSQSSRRTSSQLSPLQPDGSISSSNRSIFQGFDLSQSPFAGGNSIIAVPYGTGTMTPGKEDDGLMPFGDEERELQALDDWGIEIDADGNIVPAMEEPQLPRLPHLEEKEHGDFVHQDQFVPVDDQGDVFMAGANVLYSDPPLPLQGDGKHREEQEQEQQQEQEGQEVAVLAEISSGQAPVRVQRKRRRPNLAPDEQTKISRQELKSWSTNYLANAEQASQPRHAVTASEARKNAFNLVFGHGIAGVGFPTGVPGLSHPLAPQFAGEGLTARLLGIIITHPDRDNREVHRGRRRSALEALELEQDDIERRVRRRPSNDESSQDPQHAQPQLFQGDDALLSLPGDDELPPIEVGRRAGSVLPDLPSDVPWNRPSSQIPSSSVKGAGSKPPSRQVSASPLHGRGSLLIPGPEVERFSDNQPFFGSDGPGSEGFAPLHSGPAGGSGSIPSHPLLPGGDADMLSTSQVMRAALDREGRNFLTYIESVTRTKGYYPSENENDSKRWVEFESLFEAEDQKRAVVAQAFYHVLSLATKSVIRVTQDGQGSNEPFGTIRLGVEMLVEGEEGMADLEADEEMHDA